MVFIKKKKIKSCFATAETPGLYLLLCCVHVGLCVRVLPVSMWSTELNMWSDVRGKLLTLRPLSVLSLREWALHENRHHYSFAPDHRLSKQQDWPAETSAWSMNGRNTLCELHIRYFTLEQCRFSFCQRNIFHENCWQIDKLSNWNFFPGKTRFNAFSWTYGIPFLSTLWWRQQKKCAGKWNLCG